MGSGRLSPKLCSLGPPWRGKNNFGLSCEKRHRLFQVLGEPSRLGCGLRVCLERLSLTVHFEEIEHVEIMFIIAPHC